MTKRFTKQKFSLCLSIAFVLLGFTSRSQIGSSAWKFSNPVQFGFNVIDVSFVDDNNGIAVGVNGSIAKTTDAGVTWQYAAFTFKGPTGSIQKGNFNKVHFVTPTIAYAAGNGGLFAKSIDGGLNWTAMNNPMFPNRKNIYAMYFVNKDVGYIGGEAIDGTYDNPSAPKLYFTKDGGSTWGSIDAPTGAITKAGYVANPAYPPVAVNVSAIGKEIHGIVFLNNDIGYITGSGYVTISTENVGWYSDANSASLIWKFNKGVLTDYSLSKEAIGDSGIRTSPPDPTTTYKSALAAQQTIKALLPINDSLLLVASFNNGIVARIKTGVNDRTENVSAPGTYINGKYEILNNANANIPPVQVLRSYNFFNMKQAYDKKTIYMNFGNGEIAMTKDSGRNWQLQRAIPENNTQAYNTFNAVDVTPNGKVFALGQNGVAFDSMPGSTWKSSSNYHSATPGGIYNRIDFADCNNGIATGGRQITATKDGGKTWIDNVRQDFGDEISITGLSYVNPSKMVMSTNVGGIYTSADQGVTIDQIFADPHFGYYSPDFPEYGGMGGSISDLATSGKDSIWAFGYRYYGTSQKTVLFRSFNAGATWDTIKAPWPLDNSAPTIKRVKFFNQNIGYAVADKGLVYKTTDAGSTWTNISPVPASNSSTTYNDLSLVDDKTIFIVGGGYSSNAARVYKSTDAGATWTNIVPVIPGLSGFSYAAVAMHDANNGYILRSDMLLKTTDGGTSWTMDAAPSDGGLSCAVFANKAVPAGISIASRKLFAGVITGIGAGGHIMEYGNPLLTEVSSTEVATNASCTQATGGTITVTTTGGIAPYTYSINGGAFQTSNSFTGLAQGIYTIVIKDAFCGLLTKKDTIAFDNSLAVSTNVTDTTVCSGAPVQLVATSVTGASYAWSPATGLSAANINNPIAIANTNTTYTVTATLGTCVKTATVKINIKSSPLVNAGADKTIVDGTTIQLDGSGISNPLSIAWTPAATLTNANTYTPTAKPTVTTDYTLTVKNNEGCTSIDQTTVTVIPYCVKVMNAFTPNGDGTNDKWLVTSGGACTTQVIAKVFNRYGSVVYSNDNYQNNWDGSYKGKPIPDGTYYYVINYILINGRTVSVKGDVTILR